MAGEIVLPCSESGDAASDFSTADSAAGATNHHLPEPFWLPAELLAQTPRTSARETKKIPPLPASASPGLFTSWAKVTHCTAAAAFFFFSPCLPARPRCSLCQPTADGRRQGSFITSALRPGLLAATAAAPAALATPPKLCRNRGGGGAAAAAAPSRDRSEAACHVGKWNVNDAAVAAAAPLQGNCKCSVSAGETLARKTHPGTAVAGGFGDNLDRIRTQAPGKGEGAGKSLP